MRHASARPQPAHLPRWTPAEEGEACLGMANAPLHQTPSRCEPRPAHIGTRICEGVPHDTRRAFVKAACRAASQDLSSQGSTAQQSNQGYEFRAPHLLPQPPRRHQRTKPWLPVSSAPQRCAGGSSDCPLDRKRPHANSRVKLYRNRAGNERGQELCRENDLCLLLQPVRSTRHRGQPPQHRDGEWANASTQGAANASRARTQTANRNSLCEKKRLLSRLPVSHARPLSPRTGGCRK